MMHRRTMGVNIARHHQIRAQQGGILPMGTPAPHVPILPMAQPRRGLLARVLGR